jgi:hypothetical protein
MLTAQRSVVSLTIAPHLTRQRVCGFDEMQRKY